MPYCLWDGAVSTVQEAAINFRQLRYFVAAVEARSIKSAAQKIYISQPALGAQIRRLESEVGAVLLNRHSRGVEPTAAGVVLYERARSILQQLEDVREEIRDLSPGTTQEKLVFGITSGIANVLGSDVLLASRELIPSVSLSVTESISDILIDAMERGRVDLALAYEVSERLGVKRTPLYREELVYAVSPDAPFLENPPIGGKQVITLMAALAYPLVQAGETNSMSRLIEGEAARHGLPFNVMYQASSISIMKSILLRGKAAGILPRAIVAEELASGALVFRRITEPVLLRTLYLISATDRRTLRAEADVMAFVETIARLFANYQGEVIHPLPRDG